MTMLIYPAIAIVLLILVVVLFLKPKPHAADREGVKSNYEMDLGNGRWMDLSERIFDPADWHWLHEELAFPKLANSLMEARKHMAIRWLKALETSFDDLVRSPEPALHEIPTGHTNGNWQMLWLTIRFKFLILYASFVVRALGPYHRLIPSFSWVPMVRKRERSSGRAALANGSH